ncbi:MAG: ABC transporter permease [Candidatus Heimdallarchaeota archaeon]|nr:MAG: ABC transporter permease [Candidatus Heimdallarchaeota archaeon]
MSFRQIFGVTQRMGLQLVRSKWTIPYLVIFPLFFIGLYWIGFSTSPVGINQTFLLGVINQDTGVSDDIKSLFQNETIMGNASLTQYHNSDVLNRGFGSEFIDILGNLTYSNITEATHIFDISHFDTESEANNKLFKRDLDILIVLNPNFSNTTLSMLNRYWYNTYGLYFHEMIQLQFPQSPDLPSNINDTIHVIGDESYLNFKLAKSVLSIIIHQYQDLTTAFKGPGGSISIKMKEEYTINIPKYSLFELSIPGLIAFGIIIQPSLVAMFFCMEFRQNNTTFDRIRLAPSSGGVYIIGSILIQIPVMIIQSLILFLSSLILGFNPAGNLFLGFLIALTIFPFTLSLVYISSAFLSNEDVVGNVLGFGAPFMAFMSGAFIEVPKIILIPKVFPTASGYPRDFLLWDLLPLTHSTNALRQVLLYDFEFFLVFPDIFMSLILSFIYLIFSVLVFYYLRFKIRS